MAKVFYDVAANKEVYDISGIKTMDQVKAEFGLGAGTQEVTLGLNEAPEVVGGNLVKFDYVARSAAQLTAREAAREGKETAIKAKLGLSDADFTDLKVALG